jgi:hypothetical protein
MTSASGAIIRLRRVPMTLARFLAASFVLCSAIVFAQQKPNSPAVSTLIADARQSASVASAEPWKFIPNQAANAVTDKAPNYLQIDKYKLVPSKKDARTLLLGPEADAGMILSGLSGDVDGVTTCLKIRSYVVARDSKDSDSTHPVSYSTCQPSSRYRVRTTEIQTQSVDR